MEDALVKGTPSVSITTAIARVTALRECDISQLFPTEANHDGSQRSASASRVLALDYICLRSRHFFTKPLRILYLAVPYTSHCQWSLLGLQLYHVHGKTYVL